MNDLVCTHPLNRNCRFVLSAGLVLLLSAVCLWSPAQAAEIRVRILETTDVHMHLLNHDYYQDKVTDEYGLAKTWSLIKAARAEVPNSLLFDNGDLLQGNPLGDYVARVKPLQPGHIHPAYKVLNQMGVDAANIGNHEFNYGLPFLKQALAGANFPIVSANVVVAQPGAELFPTGTEPVDVPRAVDLRRDLDAHVAARKGGQLHRTDIRLTPARRTHERNHETIPTMTSVNLTIDGRSLLANADETILEAARRHGIDIPTLCFHEALPTKGSCWLCIVEIKGKNHFIPACSTKVSEGMVVETSNDELAAMRRQSLERIIAMHCGDCFAPCELACPAGCDIPEFIAAIASGNDREAIEIIVPYRKRVLAIFESLISSERRRPVRFQ